MTELRIEPFRWRGARLGPEHPLPYFRDPQTDAAVPVADSLPPGKRERLGWQTGFRVLPYRMQDSYSRQRETLTFNAAVLENESLRATFLPELGGRLISLVHKPAGRELLFRNDVFQPANLAIRNAWFAGGIEWNVGQYGHTFATCSPVFAAAIRGPRGEPALRLYEFERCQGLTWQIDFSLPPGAAVLTAYARVINPSDHEAPMYWWTNVAVPEAPGVRVLAPARQAICVDPSAGRSVLGMSELPRLPAFEAADATYALNAPCANEFFFQCDQSAMPWEAALDSDGSGFVEASTPRLKYRKAFYWGMHPGGRHWQEFLCGPNQAYFEIQAGLAPTQLHGLVMPAHTAWDWTQVFGYLETDPAHVHAEDWAHACNAVEPAVHGLISPAELASLEAAHRARADDAPERILVQGSGWGALEGLRRNRQAVSPITPAFDFPASSLGDDQRPWKHLLERGYLPEQAPERPPGAWMVQSDWMDLLEASLQIEAGRHWTSLLHLGVMRMERFDQAGAEAAWRESIERVPSAWAFRNLAVLYQRQAKEAQALECYQKAWELAARHDSLPLALAVECMQTLVAGGRLQDAHDLFASLPASLQDADRIQILCGHIALRHGDLDTVDDVLRRDYTVIREGETELTDLWLGLWVRRLARQTGRPLSEISAQEVERLHPPPGRIDFRSLDPSAVGRDVWPTDSA